MEENENKLLNSLIESKERKNQLEKQYVDIKNKFKQISNEIDYSYNTIGKI
jgi:hypothetical protein